MTGLSMRTLVNAYAKASILETAMLHRSVTSGMFSEQQKLKRRVRQSVVFRAALLAKIDAAEAQMKADAERIAELEGDLEQLREDERSAWDTSEAWRKRCAKAARAIEGLD